MEDCFSFNVLKSFTLILISKLNQIKLVCIWKITKSFCSLCGSFHCFYSFGLSGPMQAFQVLVQFWHLQILVNIKSFDKCFKIQSGDQSSFQLQTNCFCYDLFHLQSQLQCLNTQYDYKNKQFDSFNANLSSKMPCILKQTWNIWLQTFSSMYDLSRCTRS